MNPPEPKVEDWQLKVGLGMFVVSILLPVVGVPLVAMLGLSKTATASVSSALLVAAEVMGLAAIAVMGKKGYAALKQRVLGWIEQYGPPSKVSPLRYKIGLILFAVPLLFGWLSVYTSEWIPGFADYPLYFAVGGDMMLLSSLFVLGGDFWDKVRALFFHDAEAHFPMVSVEKKTA